MATKNAVPKLWNPYLWQDGSYRSNPEDGWVLSWYDEFDADGTPDPTKWTYEIGDIRNSEAQYYTSRPQNVIVDDGCLVITALKESYMGFEYTSASVITKNLKQFGPNGRFVIRSKLALGRGTWPAHWFLGTDGENWPDCGEIDLMEFVGFDPTYVHTNVITPNFQAGQYFTSNTGFDLNGFNTYELIWNQTEMTFYINGVLVNTFPNLGGAGNWPFDSTIYLLLNLAIGGSWGGMDGIDDSIFPVQLLIDYVRYYEWVE